MRKGLIGLILVLGIVLAGLCAYVFLAEKPPEDETARKVWLYAREHDIPYSSYPQSLIDLFRRNPETEKFVLEYPIASAQTGAVDVTGDLIEDAVPLFLQWDQRWGYIPYGEDVAGLTGCGPVCLSMAAVYVTGDASLSPDRLLKFAEEEGYYVRGSGSSWTLISEGGPKLGLKVTEIPLVEGLICKHLEAGTPIICAMGPGDFTTSGHFIVLTGMEEGGIRVNDPNSMANSEKIWTYAQIADQIRNLWTVEKGQ